MGLLEWPQVFSAASGKNWTYGLGDLWGGKFSVEIGQSLSGYLICGRQTHILGQELKLVVDPESFFALERGRHADRRLALRRHRKSSSPSAATWA